MTNETKLHPAVEALQAEGDHWQQWKLTSEKEGEYWCSGSHQNIRECGERIATGLEPNVASLFIASPEMLSWMVQDLTNIGMTDGEMAEHKRVGRDIIRRASNGKINL